MVSRPQGTDDRSYKHISAVSVPFVLVHKCTPLSQLKSLLLLLLLLLFQTAVTEELLNFMVYT